MRTYQRRLLIVFGSLLGVLAVFFLLFNLLVLNLFEGKVDSLVELVPTRGISFVVATDGIGPGLDALPDSAFMARLRQDPAFAEMAESEVWQEIESRYAIRDNLRKLQEARDRLPIDLVERVFGRETIVAGAPEEGTPNEWDLVLLTRITPLVKIGVDFSTHGLVRARLDRSMRLEKVPGTRYRQIALEQDGKEHRFFFARVKDALIVANKQGLMDSVMGLNDAGPALSLAFDRTFARADFPKPEGPAEFSYFFNVDRIWQTLSLDAKLEDPRLSSSFRFLSQFFNASRIALGAGQLDLADGPKVVGELVLAKEAFEFDHEYRIFNTEPMAVSQAIDRFLPFVPEDCFGYFFLQCPTPDLFTLLSSQVQGRARQLVNETLAEQRVYRDFEHFLQDAAANFGDLFAVSVARVDYGPELPYQPVPAVSLYFDILDRGRLDSFLEYLTGDEFALTDVTREDYGGATVVRGKQKLPIIEWVPEFCYAILGDTFVLTTEFGFLKRIVDVQNQTSPALFRDPTINDLIAELPREINAFGVWDLQRALDWADDYKHYLAARQSIFPESRWPEERLKAERRVLAAQPGLRRGTPQFDSAVNRELDRVAAAYEEAEKARWAEEYGEKIRWARVLGRGAGGMTFRTDRIRMIGKQNAAFQDGSSR